MFVESLPAQLVEGQREHKSTRPAPEQIRLRMALHAGEVQYDDHGVAGAAVNLTFRLLDAEPLKSALAGSPGVLALATSSWFFDEVVRHSPAADPNAYRRVRVRVKEPTPPPGLIIPTPARHEPRCVRGPRHGGAASASRRRRTSSPRRGTALAVQAAGYHGSSGCIPPRLGPLRRGRPDSQ